MRQCIMTPGMGKSLVLQLWADAWDWYQLVNSINDTSADNRKDERSKKTMMRFLKAASAWLFRVTVRLQQNASILLNRHEIEPCTINKHGNWMRMFNTKKQTLIHIYLNVILKKKHPQANGHFLKAGPVKRQHAIRHKTVTLWQTRYSTH